MWFLRDPLQLSDSQLFLPDGLAPLLTLLDGQRTAAEVHAAFCRLVGAALDPEITREAIRQLDEALLLQNRNMEEAMRARVEAFRAQPFRPPALAGNSYPAEAGALRELLESYGDTKRVAPWHGRGVVSPHIDYGRGGRVYAQVWQAAKAAILEADLVLILGTDHYGGPGTVTLTKQPYATPFGLLPADEALIDKLAAAVGAEAAYAEELHHRQEHSVELSAVWLHHIFDQAGRAPCPMVPILVGSFHHFLANGQSTGIG